MNLKLDFYHLYSVFDDNGEWQAVLPDRKFAEDIGDLLRDRTGRGYQIRDEGMRNPVMFESRGVASKLPFLYRIGTADEQDQLDRWLGSFASYFEATRYYGYCDAVLCEPCVFRKVQPGGSYEI